MREERRLGKTVEQLNQALETGDLREINRLERVAEAQREAWLRSIRERPVHLTHRLVRFQRELRNPDTTLVRRQQLDRLIGLTNTQLASALADAAETLP